MDFETVVEVYRQTNSTKQTAKLLSISEVKVRRILITCGLWQSQTSNQIGDLYRQGRSVKEIAQQLFMPEKNVQAPMEARANQQKLFVQKYTGSD